MKIVTVTTLFPNHKEPKLGVFIKTRMWFLKKAYPDIDLTVIAPVPWFPLGWGVFGQYAKYAGVKSVEMIDGVTVYHPKYLVLPKIGMLITPYLLSKAIKRCLKTLIKLGQNFDVIDGHYFYPDGVAVERVASQLNIPFTCTARGTDINLIPEIPAARRQLSAVFANSAHMMSVCQALKDEMIKIEAPAEKITVLRNGVDLDLFCASDKQQQQKLKKQNNLDSDLILSVGWLVERKGHHLIIEALNKIPNAILAIIGDGPEQKNLKDLTNKLGLKGRVKFLGPLNQKQLNTWFNMADCTVLASSREGWANVLLESMASGAPVVATNVWGTPEVVQDSIAGVLVDRTVESITDGIKGLLASGVNRVDVREYAERFDWQATSDGLYDIFRKIQVDSRTKKRDDNY